MQYQLRPFTEIDAAPVTLAGVGLMAVSLDAVAHLIDAKVFETLFEAPGDARQADGNGKPVKLRLTEPPLKVPRPRKARVNGNPEPDYPEALGNPLATTQRAVYDALKGGPKTPRELSNATGLDSTNACAAVYALRKKNLACGNEDTPVMWRLA